MKRDGQPIILLFGAKPAPAWQRLMSCETQLRSQADLQAVPCEVCAIADASCLLGHRAG